MKNILIFLGDHRMRENVGEVLRIQGYNVIPAIGIKSVSIIKMMKPDLIIIDVHQQSIDCTEVLTVLKSQESTKNIRFVFIGSTNDSAERKALMEKGADAFMTIPFSLTDMLLTLKNLLDT